MNALETVPADYAAWLADLKGLIQSAQLCSPDGMQWNPGFLCHAGPFEFPDSAALHPSYSLAITRGELT